jgi:hypothetical protein
MTRAVIPVTFGLLGFAWYAMSGGAEFQPGDTHVSVWAEAHKAMPVRDTVTRSQVSTPFLADIDEELAKIALVTSQRPAPQPAVVEQVEYLRVNGSRVNLRKNPNTKSAVLTQLTQGQEVEVLASNETGWVRLRSLDGDRIGWMSKDFLTSSN